MDRQTHLFSISSIDGHFDYLFDGASTGLGHA